MVAKLQDSPKSTGKDSENTPIDHQTWVDILWKVAYDAIAEGVEIDCRQLSDSRIALVIHGFDLSDKNTPVKV